jgi:hypothetical protein
VGHTHGIEAGPDQPQRTPEPKPREVLVAVGRALKITVAEIKGLKRWPAFDLARKAAALALRRRGNSYPEIGRVLGGRHHTTVINLVDRALEIEAAGGEVGERLTAAVVEGVRVGGRPACAAPCRPPCPSCSQPDTTCADASGGF